MVARIPDFSFDFRMNFKEKRTNITHISKFLYNFRIYNRTVSSYTIKISISNAVEQPRT